MDTNDAKVLEYRRKQRKQGEDTVDDQNVTIERMEEFLAVNGNVFKREISEKIYNKNTNTVITRHGIDILQMDCGHVMKDYDLFGGRCYVCQKTLCDECATMINGFIFCKMHVFKARCLVP